MTKWIAIARNERTGLAENDHGTLMTAKGPRRNGGGLSISWSGELKPASMPAQRLRKTRRFRLELAGFHFVFSVPRWESAPIRSHDSLMTEWHLSPFRPFRPSKNQ
jgi:hypothetical protein